MTIGVSTQPKARMSSTIPLVMKANEIPQAESKGSSCNAIIMNHEKKTAKVTLSSCKEYHHFLPRIYKRGVRFTVLIKALYFLQVLVFMELWITPPNIIPARQELWEHHLKSTKTYLSMKNSTRIIVDMPLPFSVCMTWQTKRGEGLRQRERERERHFLPPHFIFKHKSWVYFWLHKLYSQMLASKLNVQYILLGLTLKSK